MDSKNNPKAKQINQWRKNKTKEPTQDAYKGCYQWLLQHFKPERHPILIQHRAQPLDELVAFAGDIGDSGGDGRGGGNNPCCLRSSLRCFRLGISKVYQPVVLVDIVVAPSLMAPSQFEKLLGSFVRSLDAFKASLDQYGSAIRKHDQTSENQNQKPLPIDLRSELRFPVSVSEYYEAEQRERKSAWRQIRGGLEIVGVTVAVVLATLTYHTLQKVSSQANSAQNQVVIMQQQLEATDRPWVEVVSVESTDGITFYRRIDNGLAGLHASFKMRVKNIGHSAAIHIKMVSQLVFEYPGDANREMRQKQIAICSAMEQ